MTNNSASKSKSSITAIIAAIVSIMVSIGSLLVALKANKLAFASLQNSYTPWLQITGVEPSVLEPNEIEIKYICKNFANGGPALNLEADSTHKCNK